MLSPTSRHREDDPARPDTSALLPRGDVGIAPCGTNILIESLVICRALLFIGGKLDRTVLLFVLIYTQLGKLSLHALGKQKKM